MRYFALYQREFSVVPQPLTADSHVFVDYTTADDLEEVFAQFQGEVMTEERRCRVLFKFVRHTSMSVRDVVIDEAGSCFTVMPVGFKETNLSTPESRAELALHLLSLGLEGTPGWAGLFAHDAALLTAAIVDRLRNDAYGVGSNARRPYQFPPALEAAP
ncbi:MAG: hypothetical protein AVDCRST_MAG86-4303 [uncultured Truepera sp.]|uniref:Uncharacterized protein n=1 Tax=uncultured Truepera sp. TaxID=543023 RepID=A0A6J4VU03_9DEIN|nr:MAG: hypothetical protein AVDCRST_MAG86-4303 [uncultured Truepera sp.]